MEMAFRIVNTFQVAKIIMRRTIIDWALIVVVVCYRLGQNRQIHCKEVVKYK